MSSQTVHFLVELSIHDGKLQDFQAIAKAMVDGTANEPGAAVYEFYFSADGKRCRLLETYADAAAVHAHISGHVVQQLVPKLLGCASLDRFEVYGTPDAESAAILAHIGAKIYAHWDGVAARRAGSAKAGR